MRTDDLLRIFRHHLWWVLPVVLLLVNLVVLASYRPLYSGRSEALAEAITKENGQVDKLVSQRQAIASLVARSRAARDGIRTMYGQQFATESERLTAVLREVRELAHLAGVVPTRMSYPEEVFDDFGLIKRSMNFAVDGSYKALRLFINNLELSSSFLVLETLGLRESDVGLSIRVELSTLFSGRDAPIDVLADDQNVEG